MYVAYTDPRRRMHCNYASLKFVSMVGMIVLFLLTEEV